MLKLAPSILSADFGHLAEDVKKIEEGGADYIHVDVMDGHFVPNISFGAPVMKCLNGKTGLPYDVHLMIENPDKYIEDFVTPQTEYITVHQEACTHLHRTVQNIKSKGIKAGVSINPATPVSTLECILPDVDLVLIMSVNPGFGGQKFIAGTLDKVRELAEIKRAKNLNFVIEIDGGITLDNIQEVMDAGVEMAVAGSAVFKAEDVVQRVRDFKKF
ncbi:MAG: ribulose-phosphate 3-epimerase [Firmicutes bacterium]|nr:ribulose-phosphate 3-epimerase [Bacillota bacterium]